MKKFNFDFIKNVNKFLIAYAIIFVIGVAMIFVSGINVDIQFKGGSQITYSYTGDIDTAKVANIAEEELSKKVTVTESAGYTDDTSKKVIVSVSGNSTIKAEQTDNLLTALQKEFADNKIEQAEVISVSATIGTTFFFKCLVAVVIAGVLVVAYVAVRFRKIGGISAGLFSLVCLVLDILVAFFSSVIFGLAIDSNFIAVVLTLLGYSLNDTIIIFDRIRENKRIMGGDTDICKIVNISDNQCLRRNIITAFATFLAIVTILVVAEFNGLFTLRSLVVPLACGMVSGSFTSICIGPVLWAMWTKRAKK